jgi:AraC family transcriptional regulator of adaptative response / DNA-3-methyladenine glycosylase II
MTRRSLLLEPREPFLAAPLLRFLGERAVAGVEELASGTFRRAVHTPHGPAVIALTPLGTDGIELAVDASDRRAVAPAVETAGRLFDLDADPDAIRRVLRRDPVLRPLVRRHRGIRVPGAADGFEIVVRAVLGQQVSVPAARTMLGRVAARFGTPVPAAGAVTTAFPGPDRLADAPLEELGVTRARAATIRRVAGLVAAGELDLSGRGDADETADALLGLDGIGPWTVAYVRMRALGDRDAFPAGDLGIRRAFERLGLDGTSRAVAERAEAWRPHRAYAAMLLWQALPPAPKREGS